jgi:hypothetical protein
LIEQAKVKTVVEVASTSELVPTLELLMQTAKAGKLDALMDVSSL